MKLLEPMINRFYLEQQKYNNRPMRKFHPSTIGFCQRRIVFDMLMVPRLPADDILSRIFENGHSMHARYEHLFDHMGILVQAEMKLESEDISGHTDALIRIRSLDNPMGIYYLVELKSASYKSFKWMRESNKPKKEHKAQLTFYMYLSGVHKGILFVECKDNQEVWEYQLDYDPDYGEYLMSRANWLIGLAKQRVLPKIPEGHTPSYYKCGECPYNFYCHSKSIKQNGEVRYPIPAQSGSVLEQEIHRIIYAAENGQPIPDVIQGDTAGDLIREVEIMNNTMIQHINTI